MSTPTILLNETRLTLAKGDKTVELDLSVLPNEVVAPFRGGFDAFTPEIRYSETIKIFRLWSDVMLRTRYESEGIMRLSDVKPKETTWLWNPYIPHGELTTVVSRCGSGKTMLAIDIASHVTKGFGLPGEVSVGPRNVLYFVVEDSIEKTIRTRAERQGADLNRLLVKRCDEYMDKVFIKKLDMLMETEDLGLVVFDPIISFLESPENAKKTRPILEGLREVAEKHNCPTLLINHFTKTAESKGPEKVSIYDMRGSGVIPDVCRSIFFIWGGTTTGFVEHRKANLSALGPDTTFHKIEGVLVWENPDETFEVKPKWFPND
jgi:hypothetical protein